MSNFGVKFLGRNPVASLCNYIYSTHLQPRPLGNTMFINNWYVACIADEIKDKPRRARILAHNFVLFRHDENNIHCLSDSCVHRGASLSLGQCQNGGIICPQHGWEFNHGGKCTLIPAGTKTPTETPKRARVPAYPVEEKYGLVFAWLFNW